MRVEGLEMESEDGRWEDDECSILSRAVEYCMKFR